MGRHGTLEIPEDVAFERRAWTVQRAGWVVMLLLVLATLAGVFGRGPLSRAEARADGLTLRYERFCRSNAETALELQVAAGRDGRARVWFDRRYLARFELVDVQPTPERVETDDDVVRLTFDAAAPPADVRVRIRARPRGPGVLAGAVGVLGGGQVRFEQLNYP